MDKYDVGLLRISYSFRIDQRVVRRPDSLANGAGDDSHSVMLGELKVI